ncbi:hypothetical protein RAA17_15050 [Komagataeibacter rhaeticus]|nr:hypothetical protein [Komagataeibacter rhaeticus]
MAFIGGQDNPAQKRVMQTFQDGARAARPGMLATGIITGDYNNASRGREAVESLVAKGWMSSGIHPMSRGLACCRARRWRASRP